MGGSLYVLLLLLSVLSSVCWLREYTAVCLFIAQLKPNWKLDKEKEGVGAKLKEEREINLFLLSEYRTL